MRWKKKDKKTKTLVKQIKKLNKPHKKIFDNTTVLDETTIIKLEKVHKYFVNGFSYEHVLKGINLTINKGEFVVIVGASGSGKTTLLTILSALERPSMGNCFMFSQNTIHLSNAALTKIRAKHIGYVFQQYGLLENLSVEDNIKLIMSLSKKQKSPFSIDQLLELVGLLAWKKQKAKNLSGGQQQRVAICRALMKNPDILFGDEPTGAVNIEATKQIMQIFCDINTTYHTTIIIVTHNPSIPQLADRIIQVENGLILKNYLNTNKKKIEEINWTL